MKFSVAKALFLFLSLASLQARADCVSRLRFGCKRPSSCTQKKLENARSITFTDANFSHCEVAKIRCEANKNCENFKVIPEIDKNKIRDFNRLVRSKSTQELEEIQKIRACRSSNPDQLRLCLRKVITSLDEGNPSDVKKFQHLLKGLIKDEDLKVRDKKDVYVKIGEDVLEIDYLGRLKEETAKYKKGYNNSLIISGHSDGEEVWGGDDSYISVTFNDISKNIYNENIESVFFAACSSGGEDSLRNEIRMCGPIPPGRIYGINGTSPGNSTWSANGLSDLMRIDQKIRKDQDVKKSVKLIQKSLLRKYNPVLLASHKGENCKLQTVNSSGVVKEFDPNGKCGPYSKTLFDCLNTLAFYSPDDYSPGDVCDFAHDDNGARAYKRYLKPLLKRYHNEKYFPLVHYFGSNKDNRSYEEDWKYLGEDNIAPKIFKALYRVVQEDASCLGELEDGYFGSDVFALYRLGDNNQVKNIQKNVVDRFKQFLGPDGEYNRIAKKMNKVLNKGQCIDIENNIIEMPLIDESTFVGRKELISFAGAFYEENSRINSRIEFGDEDQCKKEIFSEKLIAEFSQLERKFHGLIDNYILRADTNVYGCNGRDDFVYEATYSFDREDQKNKYFMENSEKELECLVRNYRVW